MEVTIIERFDLSIGGRTVALFSFASREEPPYSPLDGCLLLSADPEADLLVRGSGCYSDIPPFCEWQIALSFFFSFIRGLPDTSLDVRCGEHIVGLDIFNTGDGVYPLKLLKCKQLFSSTISLDGGIEREVVTVEAAHRWHILPLDGDGAFSPSIIPSVRLVGGMISDYEIAIDTSPGIHHGPVIPPLHEMLSVIWCCLVFWGGRKDYTVYYRGVPIRLSDGTAYIPCKKI